MGSHSLKFSLVFIWTASDILLYFFSFHFAFLPFVVVVHDPLLKMQVSLTFCNWLCLPVYVYGERIGQCEGFCDL